MPVFSMTGYAAVQAPLEVQEHSDQGAGSLGLEIRSVNSRFLDLALRLPDDLRQAEPGLRELIGRQLKRGKVELRAGIESAKGSALPRASVVLLEQLLQAQKSIQAHLPDAAGLSVAEVLRLSDQPRSAPQDLQAQLLKLAQQALRDLCSARQREGSGWLRCSQTEPASFGTWPVKPNPWYRSWWSSKKIASSSAGVKQWR